MELDFVKNIQFTRLIKVDGRLKEFNFRKPNSKQEGSFTVDVMDELGARIIFNMEKKESNWRITNPQLPVWVLESEHAFQEIIDKEFKLD